MGISVAKLGDLSDIISNLRLVKALPRQTSVVRLNSFWGNSFILMTAAGLAACGGGGGGGGTNVASRIPPDSTNPFGTDSPIRGQLPEIPLPPQARTQAQGSTSAAPREFDKDRLVDFSDSRDANGLDMTFGVSNPLAFNDIRLSPFDDVITVNVNSDLMFFASAGDDTITGHAMGSETISYIQDDAAITATYTSADSYVVTHGGSVSYTDTLIDIDRIVGTRFADTVSYAGQTTPQTIDLSVTDLYVSIENIIGGDDDDVITGNDSANRLSGGAGADTLGGGVGNDTLNGDAGDDILNGGADNDILHGGDDADTLNGDTGNDTLNGDAGDDILNGGADNDILNGGADNDTLNGGADNDALNGDAGDDTLNGGVGNDSLNGGADNDNLNGGIGNDRLTGGDGADTFMVSIGQDTITDFNAAEDRINLAGLGITSATDERLTLSRQGSDWVISIIDAFDSSVIHRTVVQDYDGAQSAAVLDFATLIMNSGTATSTSADEVFIGATGTETVEYSGNGVAYLYVTDIAGNDRYAVESFSDDNINIMGYGMDILESIGTIGGSTENDAFFLSGLYNGLGFDGGAGDSDVISYFDVADFANLSFTITDSDITISRGGVHNLNPIADIEKIALSRGNDTLTHTGTTDYIFIGGAGNDTLTGRANGGDVASYEDGMRTLPGAGIRVTDSGANFRVDGSAVGLGRDTLTNINAIIGSRFDDYFESGTGDDTFIGSEGFDEVNYGDSNVLDASVSYVIADANSDRVLEIDVSALGLGMDKLGDDIEAIRFRNDGDSITVNADVRDLTLFTGGGDDKVTGGGGTEFLHGGGGEDILDGGGGNDIIYGGTGRDTLTGGDGNDIFVVIGSNGQQFDYTEDGLRSSFLPSTFANIGNIVFDKLGLSLSDLNSAPGYNEYVAGETIDGGAGLDTVMIFGEVDYSSADASALQNVGTFVVNSQLTLTTEQLLALSTAASGAITIIGADDTSVLILETDGTTDTLELGSHLNFEGELSVTISQDVTLEIDAADVTAVENAGAIVTLMGDGTVEADSSVTNLRSISFGEDEGLAVMDDNGNPLVPAALTPQTQNAPYFGAIRLDYITENRAASQAAYIVAANDRDSSLADTSFTLSGADAGFLEIAHYNNGFLTITLQDSGDYEAFADSDSNNLYEFTITANDGANTATRVASLAVLNDPADDVASPIPDLEPSFVMSLPDVAVSASESSMFNILIRAEGVGDVQDFVNALILTITDSSGTEVEQTVSLGGVTFTSDAIEFDSNLSSFTDGAFTISAEIHDQDGEVYETAENSFTLDTTAPVINGAADIGFGNIAPAGTAIDDILAMDIMVAEANEWTLEATSTSATFAADYTITHDETTGIISIILARAFEATDTTATDVTLTVTDVAGNTASETITLTPTADTTDPAATATLTPDTIFGETLTSEDDVIFKVETTNEVSVTYAITGITQDTLDFTPAELMDQDIFELQNADMLTAQLVAARDITNADAGEYTITLSVTDPTGNSVDITQDFFIDILQFGSPNNDRVGRFNVVTAAIYNGGDGADIVLIDNDIAAATNIGADRISAFVVTNVEGFYANTNDDVFDVDEALNFAIFGGGGSDEFQVDGIYGNKFFGDSYQATGGADGITASASLAKFTNDKFWGYDLIDGETDEIEYSGISGAITIGGSLADLTVTIATAEGTISDYLSYIETIEFTGTGDQTITIAAGSDLADFNLIAGDGNDVFDLSVSTAGQDVDVTNGGFERIIGSPHDDFITASSVGSIIDGGGGTDDITLGAGTHIVILSQTAGESAAVTTTINGFDPAQDRLDIRGIDQTSLMIEEDSGDLKISFTLAGETVRHEYVLASQPALSGLLNALDIGNPSSFTSAEAVSYFNDNDIFARFNEFVLTSATAGASGTSTTPDTEFEAARTDLGDGNALTRTFENADFTNIDAVGGTDEDDDLTIGSALDYAVAGGAGDDNFMVSGIYGNYYLGDNYDIPASSAIVGDFTPEVGTRDSAGSTADSLEYTGVSGRIEISALGGYIAVSQGDNTDYLPDIESIIFDGELDQTIVLNTALSGVTINAGGGSGNGDVLDLSGAAPGQTFSGYEGFERIIGSSGADTITASSGGSIIDGGGADDIITLGAGADIVIISQTAGATRFGVTINGFDHTQDRLDIRGIDQDSLMISDGGTSHTIRIRFTLEGESVQHEHFLLGQETFVDILEAIEGGPDSGFTSQQAIDYFYDNDLFVLFNEFVLTSDTAGASGTSTTPDTEEFEAARTDLGDGSALTRTFENGDFTNIDAVGGTDEADDLTIGSALDYAVAGGAGDDNFMVSGIYGNYYLGDNYDLPPSVPTYSLPDGADANSLFRTVKISGLEDLGIGGFPQSGILSLRDAWRGRQEDGDNKDQFGLIIGDRRDENEDGLVYILGNPGAADRVLTAADATFTSDDTSDDDEYRQLGGGVAVGDFNNDGLQDLAVLSAERHLGSNAIRSTDFDRGGLIIYYNDGESDPFDNAETTEIASSRSRATDNDGVAYYGFDFFANIAVGDVDGDGIDDILIVSKSDSSYFPQVGSQHLYIIFGRSGNILDGNSADLVDGMIHQELPHVTSGSFRSSGVGSNNRKIIGEDNVHFVGDVNGDGADDFIISRIVAGGPLSNTVRLVFGKTLTDAEKSGDQAIVNEHSTNPSPIFNSSILIQVGHHTSEDTGQVFAPTSLGDINGDTFDDFAVANVEGGRINIIFGSASGVLNGLTGTEVNVGTDTTPNMQTRYDLSVDDPFTGTTDGFAINSRQQSGAIASYSGIPIGHGLTGIGDFNGDGIDDFAFDELAIHRTNDGGNVVEDDQDSIYIVFGNDEAGAFASLYENPDELVTAGLALKINHGFLDHLTAADRGATRNNALASRQGHTIELFGIGDVDNDGFDDIGVRFATSTDGDDAEFHVIYGGNQYDQYKGFTPEVGVRDSDSSDDDSLTYTGVSGRIEISALGGYIAVSDGSNTDYLPDIETISFDGDLNQTIVLNTVVSGVTIDAGAGGNDVLDLSALARGQTISGYTSFERIIGTSGDDTITASATGQTIDGGEGDDTITAGAGVDIFILSSGDDTINGFRTAGDDLLDFSRSGIVVTGGSVVNTNDLMLTYTIEDADGNEIAASVTLVGVANIITGLAGDFTAANIVEYLTENDLISSFDTQTLASAAATATGEAGRNDAALHDLGGASLTRTLIAADFAEIEVVGGTGGDDDLTIASDVDFVVAGGAGDDKFMVTGLLGNEYYGDDYFLPTEVPSMPLDLPAPAAGTDLPTGFDTLAITGLSTLPTSSRNRFSDFLYSVNGWKDDRDALGLIIGDPGGRGNPGRFHIINPADTNDIDLLASPAGVQTFIDSINGQFGDAVAIGDFDGDGDLDLAVLRNKDNDGSSVNSPESSLLIYYNDGNGDPFHDDSNTAVSPVIINGHAPVPGLSNAHGSADNDYENFAGLSVGDLNGDGFDDIILTSTDQESQDHLGSHGADYRDERGFIHVIFGRDTAIPGGTFGTRIDSDTFTQDTVHLYNNAEAEVGRETQFIGDINNDGFDDFIVIPLRTRAAYIVFGANGVGADNIDEIVRNYDRMTAGDDGRRHGQDNLDELDMGNREGMGNGDLSVLAFRFFAGNSPAFEDQHRAVELGDVNGDGVDDFAFVQDPLGRIHVIFGVDANDDSKDILDEVGPHDNSDVEGFGTGIAYLRTGTATPFVGNDDGFSIFGRNLVPDGSANVSDPIGSAFAGIGDFNGDGINDFAFDEIALQLVQNAVESQITEDAIYIVLGRESNNPFTAVNNIADAVASGLAIRIPHNFFDGDHFTDNQRAGRELDAGGDPILVGNNGNPVVADAEGNPILNDVGRGMLADAEGNAILNGMGNPISTEAVPINVNNLPRQDLRTLQLFGIGDINNDGFDDIGVHVDLAGGAEYHIIYGSNEGYFSSFDALPADSLEDSATTSNDEVVYSGVSGNLFVTPRTSGVVEITDGTNTDTLGHIEILSFDGNTAQNLNFGVANLGDFTVNLGGGNDIFTVDSDNIGNFTINGDAGNDTITGGAGDDIITGGIGNDTLTGGEGRNRFIASAANGSDIITDFKRIWAAGSSGGRVDPAQSDVLDFRGSGVSLSDLSFNITFTTGSVIRSDSAAALDISWAGGNQITLQNVGGSNSLLDVLDNVHTTDGDADFGGDAGARSFFASPTGVGAYLVIFDTIINFTSRTGVENWDLHHFRDGDMITATTSDKLVFNDVSISGDATLGKLSSGELSTGLTNGSLSVEFDDSASSSEVIFNFPGGGGRSMTIDFTDANFSVADADSDDVLDSGEIVAFIDAITPYIDFAS